MLRSRLTSACSRRRRSGAAAEAQHVMLFDAEPTAMEEQPDPVLGALVKLVENPTTRKVLRWFLSPLWLVPAFRTSMRILRSVDRIDDFERQEEFEQARALRTELLHDTKDAHSAPLWRSEGNDRLYRIRDYQGALQAFERAMTSLDRSPSLYGVALPDQIYYGAAVAAVMLGDKTKGARYGQECASLVRAYKSDASLSKSEYVKQLDEGLKWLQSQLDGTHA